LTNRLDDALIAFQKGIELQPDDFRLRQDLGGFHDRLADHNEAIKHLRAAVELAPDDPNVHRAVAVALVNAGRFSEAEQELRVSLGLREIPAALNSLGLTLMYQGRDREAVPYFTRAVSLDPQRYLSWMDLGIAYRRLGLAADAELANRRGLERAELEMAKNPRNGYVRSILAFLCARLGDRPRAESEIAQALQLSPSLADTRWMAALTYETLGNREATLSVLSPSPAQLIEDLSRWPDVADLHTDSRFKQLLANH
jgi:eukaryotic-like serine/threonine-protein kinase